MSQFSRAVSRSSVDPLPILLEISHPQLLTNIRLTNYGEDLFHNGLRFEDVFFEVTLPDLARNEQGQTHITIAAFAIQIRGIVPSLTGPRPILKLRRVRGDDPDYLEQEWPDLKLMGMNARGNQVTITAVSTVLHDSTFPDDVFDNRWPGVQGS